MNHIQLKALVQEVRRQLEELDRERFSEGADELFELQSMDLELKFTVGSSGTDKSGFDFKIVTLADECQQRAEAIQTIKLSYRVAAEYRGFGRRAHHSSQEEQRGDEGVKPLR